MEPNNITDQEYDDVVTNDDGSREFSLSKGEKCVIREGRGKHMKNAQRIAGVDKSAYMGALLSQLVTVDGEKITSEELEEYPLKDYMKMMSVFSDVNF